MVKVPPELYITQEAYHERIDQIQVVIEVKFIKKFRLYKKENLFTYAKKLLFHTYLCFPALHIRDRGTFQDKSSL